MKIVSARRAFYEENMEKLAAALTFIVPEPSLWVDGFTHSTEDPQGGEVVFLGEIVTEAHQGADSGRSCTTSVARHEQE